LFGNIDCFSLNCAAEDFDRIYPRYKDRWITLFDGKRERSADKSDTDYGDISKRNLL
jgi:hypothetical protein